MTPEARDEFLASQHVCRVATISVSGPHVSAVWYVWDGEAVWIYSITRSQRWTDLTRNPRTAVIVDAGESYGELRGVELRGSAEFVGEQPRTGAPEHRLEIPERLFASKYLGTSEMLHDGRHAWLRIVPAKIVSWDFRRLSSPARAPSL